MNKYYDVCIVGGGASGLAAAVYIKQNNINISVAVLERLSRVGKKLINTGNGRCNITNKDESVSHYHGSQSSFADYAISKYSNKKIEQFFTSIGVPIIYDDKGRGYPASLQASSVVDALRFTAEELSVDIHTNCLLKDFENVNNEYLIKTDNGCFKAGIVVLAAGLFSGGLHMGCDGSVYNLLKSKGEQCVPVSPAIVQIKTCNKFTRQLKGIKINAVAELFINESLIRRENGEVLFCDYGLSGPPILQIAREIERQSGTKIIKLDLMPNNNLEEIIDLLKSLRFNLSYRYLDEYLSGVINKRLGQVIIKATGLKVSEKVSDLSDKDIYAIAKMLKSFSFSAISTTGFDNSQVTAGGLDTNSFDDKTMMSKKHKNMYAIGEILDIDGDCGGYNLHFAFSSAFCCADNIIKEYKNGKA